MTLLLRFTLHRPEPSSVSCPDRDRQGSKTQVVNSLGRAPRPILSGLCCGSTLDQTLVDCAKRQGYLHGVCSIDYRGELRTWHNVVRPVPVPRYRQGCSPQGYTAPHGAENTERGTRICMQRFAYRGALGWAGPRTYLSMRAEAKRRRRRAGGGDIVIEWVTEGHRVSLINLYFEETYIGSLFDEY